MSLQFSQRNLNYLLLKIFLQGQIHFLIVPVFKWCSLLPFICGWLWFESNLWILLVLMHMCNVWDHMHPHTRAHKDPQCSQSVRISISFNVTRPICFQKCCHTETSPLQNRARGLGADSWDPGSLHGLFVQPNLLFCHSRPVTSEII